MMGERWRELLKAHRGNVIRVLAHRQMSSHLMYSPLDFKSPTDGEN